MKSLFSKTRLFFLLAAIGFVSMTGCKVGEDDPLVSVKSREARMTQFWTLVEVMENGNTQQKDGDLTWDIRESGTLTQETNGNIFGFETAETTTGTWEFRDDKADLYVNLDGTAETFSIDRLSNADLWLSRMEDGNVYELRFENR